MFFPSDCWVSARIVEGDLRGRCISRGCLLDFNVSNGDEQDAILVLVDGAIESNLLSIEGMNSALLSGHLSMSWWWSWGVCTRLANIKSGQSLQFTLHLNQHQRHTRAAWYPRPTQPPPAATMAR
jgi:hypothetical protein